jgi:spore germination protein GerM
MNRSTFLALLCATMTLVSCSVPEETDVRPLGDQYRITIESADQSTVQTAREAVIIYLVKGPDLIRRTRLAATPLTPESLIELIASGPTDQERETEIRSALGSGPLVIESLSTTEGSMTLDLAPGFAELPGEEQTLLIGQIVLSLFENFLVSSISVTLSGNPTAILGPGGEVIERTIFPSDFRPLVINLR